MDARSKFRTGKAVLGGMLLGVGAFIFVETLLLSDPLQHSAVGPKFFPVLVALCLAVNGAILVWQAWKHEWSEGEEWPDLELGPAGIVLAGLVLQMILLEKAGWIISTTLLFAVIARAFGSRRPLIDLAIGLLLSTLSFYLFNEGLGLSLPGGFIADYFD